MPMHDWTRVSAGTYHDFHSAWITHLKEALNAGVLPPDYYALGEQRAGDIQPDVLALHTTEGQPDEESWSAAAEHGNLVALAESPPKVSLHQEAAEDVEFYLQRQRSVVVRHAHSDRVVALIEIVSPANKHNRQTVDDFVDKVVASLRQKIHVLVIDPLPPRRHDFAGMHRAVWDRLLENHYEPPEGRPLTLVSYLAREPISAFIEPLRPGDSLIDMPLFLTRSHYVPVPLEPTYMQSWAGVPQRWKRVVDPSAE